MPARGVLGPGTYVETCGTCDGSFKVRPCEVRRNARRGYGPPKYCSMPCRARAYVGPGNPKWRGGTFRATSGYVYEYAPDHPHATAGGYVMQHRLVMERVIGRVLDPTEEVHHEDHVRDHNEPDNLDLMPSTSAHRVHHGYWRDQPCAHCSTPVRRSAGHRRRWSRAYCSRRCTALANLAVLNRAAS